MLVTGENKRPTARPRYRPPSFADCATGRIVKRWMLRLEAGEPNIVQTREVQVSANQMSESEFEYENRSGQERSYKLSTSHPPLLHLLMESFTLKAGERVKVPFAVRNLQRPLQVQVLVCVQDTQNPTPEVIAFNVNFH